MDWRTTLDTSATQPEPAPSAGHIYHEAFIRLVSGCPIVLPKGTPVTQNNVAREAGRDPSAFRKSRYPVEVLEVQEWKTVHKGEQLPSKRQQLLRQRRKKRDTKETIADLKKQRDIATGLLADADLRIVHLSEKLDDLQARLDEIQPTAKVLDLKK